MWLGAVSCCPYLPLRESIVLDITSLGKDQNWKYSFYWICVTFVSLKNWKIVIWMIHKPHVSWSLMRGGTYRLLPERTAGAPSLVLGMDKNTTVKPQCSRESVSLPLCTLLCPSPTCIAVSHVTFREPPLGHRLKAFVSSEVFGYLYIPRPSSFIVSQTNWLRSS